MISVPITVFSSNYAGGCHYRRSPQCNVINNYIGTINNYYDSSGCSSCNGSGSGSSSQCNYTELSNYVKTIKTLTDEYALGEIALVAQILTQTEYEKMAVDLNNLAKDETVCPEYEVLRKSICSSLSGLYQSILQYAVLLDTEAKLTECQTMANILKDPVLLQDYINKQKSRRLLFPDSKINIGLQAQLKPEYAKYVQLYGFPPGAVFDMDKLAQIIKNLTSQDSDDETVPCSVP